jgi:nucleoside-diphosphate-sugar epimerase
LHVLVTGGTGFVGSHTVSCLLGADHEVRLLVRDPARVARVLEPLGVDPAAVEAVEGDVTDPAAVAKALSGCDAVIHAAAVVAVDAASAGLMQDVNVGGTRNVLGLAAEEGLDPIVSVSSIAALFPPPGPVLRADGPVHEGGTPYARSKADAERFARTLQADGSPVTIVYPGGVWGPSAPTVGDQLLALLMLARYGVVPDSSGGIPVVDVRDVAATLVAALRPGQGPRRYMLGGTLLSMGELRRLLEEATGRRFLSVPAPGWLLRRAGQFGDLVRSVVSVEFPMTHEAMVILTKMVPSDDEPTLDALGLRLRPVEETLEDTLRWLADAGHLDARHVGRLAAATT